VCFVLNSNNKNSDNTITPDDLWILFKSYINSLGLARQHLDSYNALITRKLKEIIFSIREIRPMARIPRRSRVLSPLEEYDVKVVINDVKIDEPMVTETDKRYPRKILPMEARIRNITYSAPVYLDMSLIENGVEVQREQVKICDFPVMVKSVLDPTSRMSKEELKSLFNNVTVSFIANNQLLIYIDDYVIFQSYSTKIGLCRNGELWLTSKWNLTRTTLKYTKVFIDTFSDYDVETKKDIEKLIKENKIQLI